MDGWVRVLRPCNSISVISRRWKGEHERLCAMKRRLGLGRISPPAGFEPATPWSEVGSANRSATRTLPSEFGTYRLCEQRRFRWACASAQSRQNLRCSLIQAVSQEEPSDRKPDPWSLWMAGHAQLKFVITECSKTQFRLTGPIH